MCQRLQVVIAVARRSVPDQLPDCAEPCGFRRVGDGQQAPFDIPSQAGLVLRVEPLVAEPVVRARQQPDCFLPLV
jgi:hypothetical protein